jgi:hypothetical protein
MIGDSFRWPFHLLFYPRSSPFGKQHSFRHFSMTNDRRAKRRFFANFIRYVFIRNILLNHELRTIVILQGLRFVAVLSSVSASDKIGDSFETDTLVVGYPI